MRLTISICNLCRATNLVLALVLFGTAAATGADSSSASSLSDYQFKATHNSYHLDDPPNVLIDKYDVWEIELDFGIPFDKEDFIVGHDGPEPKHGLETLGDWVRNMLLAESRSDQPIILKLEAKTHKPCSPFRFPSFQCADNWGDIWQDRLRDSLQLWIGESDWITSREFEDEFKSAWPSVSELVGKVIVTLQDSHDDRDIDTTSACFFGRDIPGLTAAWPPIETKTEFKTALESSVNRLTMDDAYNQSWAIISQKQ